MFQTNQTTSINGTVGMIQIGMAPTCPYLAGGSGIFQTSAVAGLPVTMG